MDVVGHEGDGATVGRAPRRRLHTFGGGALASLQYRDFRLLWFGLAFSYVGFWMQQMAIGWLVHKLSEDPFFLTLQAATSQVPMLLLSLFGGALADRIDKRRLLIFCRSILLVLILVLAVLVISGAVQMWHLLLVSVLMGIVWSFDLPTRQALVVSLVPKDEVMNAVALNAAVMNGTQVAGPAVGGLVLNLFGIGGCFILTGTLYFCLIMALVIMRVPKILVQRSGGSILNDMVEGVKYMRRDSILSSLLITFAVIAMAMMGYNVFLPAFAGNVLHTDQVGYSTLVISSGLGAAIGSIGLVILSRFERRGLVVFITAVSCTLGLVLFSISSPLVVSAGLLVVVGASIAATNTSITALALTRAAQEYHGRVMSITQVSWGLTPVGGLLLGVIASNFGTRWALGFGGTLAFLFVIWMFASRPALRRLR